MVKRDLITYIILVIALIGLAVTLRMFVLEPHTVTTKEANQVMLEKDVVLAVKQAQLTHGDLVLYKVDGHEHIGRLIAMPGDRVTYMDDVLYLNDQVKEEPYLADLRTAHQTEISNIGYYTPDFTIPSLTGEAQADIPDGQHLILNDNRLHNDDSRSFGLIAKEDIIGVVNFRVFPISKFGFLQSETVPEEAPVTP